MSKNVKEFFKRGLMWGAWSGPIVLAIVWFCLQKVGIVTTLTVNDVILGIFTTAFMGFIAAGISVVYQIESLPKAFAGLIQCAVLYADYLGIYLLNGWIDINKIWLFTLIFIVGFCIIWLAIYIPIRIKVNKINSLLEK